MEAKMKIEYILPILVSAPPLLKILFSIWLILTLVVGAWIFTIYVTQNITKINLTYQKPYIEIKREVADFSSFLKEMIPQHKKSINEIAQRMNKNGMYSSGPHIKEQYELVKANQKKIDNQWEISKRRIEDTLIKNTKTQIEDKILKKEYEKIQQDKDTVINEIMNITDEYFARRSGTFDKNTIDPIKKVVFEE